MCLLSSISLVLWAMAFLGGVTMFTFWTSDNSLSPCGHLEPNPTMVDTYGYGRVDRVSDTAVV